MRKLRRLIRRLVAEWRIRKRRQDVRLLIEAELKMSVSLVRSGSRGSDSIYRVNDTSQKCVAVLRLINPHRKQKTVPVEMPYRLIDGENRIERELSSYTLGAPMGLTPEPLWSTNDALLCRYNNGEPILNALLQNILSPIEVLDNGWNALRQLHKLGISHMDASVQNLLFASESRQFCLVDFEFGPAEDLCFEDQCTYDFLRYLESMLKFVDNSAFQKMAEYISTSDVFSKSSMTVDCIDRLEPALERLSQSDTLWPTILTKRDLIE